MTPDLSDLQRAERTGASLLGFAVVALAVIVAGIFASGWTPGRIDNDIEWLWWMGAGFGAFGIASLGIAAFPYVGPTDASVGRRKLRWIQAGLLWLASSPVLCFTASIIDYWT